MKDVTGGAYKFWTVTDSQSTRRVRILHYLKSIFLIVGLSFVFMSYAPPADLQYIRLEYKGSGVDKPIVTILLYVDSIPAEDSFPFRVNYKLDRCEFLKVKEVIENASIEENDINAIGYYTYTIVKNKRTKVFISHNKSETASVFEEIKREVPVNSNLYARLVETISRLR